MLQGLFNYDNPVWRFIGKFGDLILLNILWIICCIPVFTVGASTTALYYVTLKLVRNDDGYTIRSFFKSFRENFKQATIIWLIMLFTGIILAIDIYFFARMIKEPTMVHKVFQVLTSGLFLLWLFVFTYVFPLQSRFYNTVKKTLFNAFFMSVRHLFYTIGILVIDVAVVIAAYVSLAYLPQAAMLFLLFGFPLIAFVNSYFFENIFKKYMPEQDPVDREMRPLFYEEDLAGQTESREQEKEESAGSAE